MDGRGSPGVTRSDEAKRCTFDIIEEDTGLVSVSLLPAQLLQDRWQLLLLLLLWLF